MFPAQLKRKFDFRVANSFGSSDGPLPLDYLQRQNSRKKAVKCWKDGGEPPKSLKEGPSVPIATKDMPFLEKVLIKSGLEDIFDARDVTEVIYRAMRDLMATETAERVADELHKALPTKDKALQMEIADLWEDTNPIVGFLADSSSLLPFTKPRPL